MEYARAVQHNPSGMTDESEQSYKSDRRVKELKSLECVGADRGFIPPSGRLDGKEDKYSKCQN